MSRLSPFRSTPKSKCEDAISVVIGKTFGSTTLPDGSQQITEVTKYKRLNDGYIYTESKVRQVVSDENSEGEKNELCFPSPTKSLDKSHDISKQDPYPSLECPSSLTLTNSSCSFESHDIDIMQVVTEDHDGDLRGEELVEEYLYDNEEDLQQPLSPKENGKGWCPNLEEDEENSLQLIKEKINMWSPRRKIKKMLHSHHNTNGFALEHQGENGDDSKGSWNFSLTCKQRLRTKKTKLLLVAIVVVVAATLAAAIALKPSEKPDTFSAEDTSIGTEVGTDLETHLGADQSKDGETNNVVTKPSTDAETNVDTEPITDTETNVDTDPSTDAETNEGTKPKTDADNENACIHLKIVLSTDESTGGDGNADGDENEWELTRKEKDSVVTIASGGPLGPNQSHTFQHCVKPGLYTFHVADSGGNGLGADGRNGYYILANGIKLGVSSFFFHDEEMTFSLPFDGDEADGDNDTACADDFFLAVKTDNRPNETKWNVVDNDTGDTVLEGGPYSLPRAVYTKRACLKNGNYTLNMHDDGGDGICCDYGKGFFVLYSDGKTIIDSDGKYGGFHSTIFLLGNNTATYSP